MPTDPSAPRPEPGPEAGVKDVVVEKTHAVQSATRDAVTDDKGSFKPAVKNGVPMAAVAAAALVLIGVLVWRRRR